MLKEIAYTLYSYTVAHPVQTQVIVLVALLVYYLVVYPVTSPLWKVPGPYIHRISYIPCYNAQRNGTWIARVHELHKKYGSVVLLSPNEVSVNGDPKFINDIYVKNFPSQSSMKISETMGLKTIFLPVWRTIVIASIRS